MTNHTATCVLLRRASGCRQIADSCWFRLCALSEAFAGTDQPQFILPKDVSSQRDAGVSDQAPTFECDQPRRVSQLTKEVELTSLQARDQRHRPDLTRGGGQARWNSVHAGQLRDLKCPYRQAFSWADESHEPMQPHDC